MPSTVLIVEDNATTRKMLRVVLESEGYRVVEAPDARAALAAVHERLPDLILQDLILPDMSGVELLRQLRAHPGGAAMPILALSGFLGRLEESQTIDAGFTAWLVKPIEPTLLLDSIRAYIPPERTPAAVGEGHRLLIVDDDPVQLKLARVHFAQLGFVVMAASGAAEALALARSHRPDVILSDVFMPHVDGFQLCLDLRQDPNLLSVPVVLVSAQYSSAADRDLAAQVGANALVSRTPDFGDVLQTILGALTTGAPAAGDRPSDQLKLRHVQTVVEQLERRVQAQAGLAQRCALQAAQLSLLSGVADALTHNTDTDAALRDVLGATLDAAGISKGALLLGGATNRLEVRQSIGFSESQRQGLSTLFGHLALLQDTVERGGSVSIPSPVIPAPIARQILEAADVATMHVVSLISGGRGVGAMVVGATRTDVTSDDCVAFARAMGHQIVQSLELTRSLGEQRHLEEQLRQAQKLEAIGQLAGGVAHDFNNLLTAVLGFSELLLSGLSDDDPARADVLEIQKAGERAAGLTRQLLAFSRKQILQPTILDMNGVISGMEPMLRRLLREDVSLELSLAQTVGVIKMDPTQLEQILVNLVVNAADAMPQGGRLTIETADAKLDAAYQQRHLPVTPGAYALLAVTDSGIGMDETTSRRIFEPFFTTKGVGKGTGLGLSTVYGIVKQSGGDISVHSEPGRGSTFKIYLPQVTSGTASVRERSPETHTAPRGSETVLLVEDDTAVRLLARVALEGAGYRVLHAANPKEAMRLATEFSAPIHLLLSDVIMPESEGPPLLDRLANVQPGLRVLYMSGYADEAIVRHGVLVEGTPFLQKPFTPIALARKVRDVLDAPAKPSPE
jgi:CheY-like chemotaxis protein